MIEKLKDKLKKLYSLILRKLGIKKDETKA